MNDKIKKLVHFLFLFGVGFAASCFVGLDGVRDSIQIEQLIIGILLCVIALGIKLIQSI